MNNRISNKRIIFSILVFILFSFKLAAEQVPTPVYYSVIMMPATFTDPYYRQFDTRLLAEDLANLLQQATRKSFEAKPFTGQTGKGIFLLLDSSISIKGNESGILQSDGKNYIRIKARYTTGISYAMYSWLEVLGFRFYLPGDDWTYIPRLNTIYLSSLRNKTYQPSFKLRMFNASGSMDAVKGLDDNRQNATDWRKWHQRNRMGSEYLRINGHIGEAFNMAHRKEIEADPTILAPVKGKRQYDVSGKLDPTNKKGVKLFADWIKKQFQQEQKNRPSFLPFQPFYTADAGDGLNYCHTAECEQAFKSVSDQVFSIVNATAKNIRSADPKAGVSTLAYGERTDTPHIDIEPNVQVMVVASAFQSVSTAAELMQRWAKKSNHISQYEYLNIGVWNADKPFFNFNEYHRNLEYLRSLNIEGITYETSFSKFASGILQYFILRYLCEPYQSPEKILNEFCEKNFEQAATPIKKLLKAWYFSDLHLKTMYDYPSFYADELGQFIQYISAAEKINGLSPKVHEKIDELKGYTIYLCKYYELFCEPESLQKISKDKSLRSAKTDELIKYTWQLYPTKIFHNNMLSEVFKPWLNESQKARWDTRNSEYFKGLANNRKATVQAGFIEAQKKYLHLAHADIVLPDSFFVANVKYSADSIRITTMDEVALGNLIYPVSFYCAAPGKMLIKWQTGSSQSDQQPGKVAMLSIESNDYRYLKTNDIYAQESSGTTTFIIPAKGHYNLYLSQFNKTHVSYVIYPGKNLFYHHKKSIMMNGLLLQDRMNENAYPNRYIALLAPNADSLYFGNIYHDAFNQSRFYSSAGNPLPVVENRNAFQNAIAIPPAMRNQLIFYENATYRWPPVLKNSAPYYFFMRYPLR